MVTFNLSNYTNYIPINEANQYVTVDNCLYYLDKMSYNEAFILIAPLIIMVIRRVILSDDKYNHLDVKVTFIWITYFFIKYAMGWI